MGAGAAAVIAGIVIGIAVVRARGSNGGGTTDQPTMPFDTAAPSTPTASTPPSPTLTDPPGFPVSARPLGPNLLYVSMQTAPGK